jgi:hypothetical protein
VSGEMRGSGQWARFRLKTRRSGSHIIWMAGVQFRLDDGRRMSPGRAAWVMAGRIDAEAVIRTCDRPGCVAIHHMRAGTMAEAAAHAIPRMLTDDEAREIIETPVKVGSRPSVLLRIARRLGVSLGLIHKVRVKGSTYRRSLGMQ